jgi:hypothetical protein
MTKWIQNNVPFCRHVRLGVVSTINNLAVRFDHKVVMLRNAWKPLGELP